MNIRLLQNLTFRSYISLVLTISMLAWAISLPAVLMADEVAPRPVQLQNVLSNSAPGVMATHTISFKITDNADNTDDIDNIRIHFASSSGHFFDGIIDYDTNDDWNVVLEDAAGEKLELDTEGIASNDEGDFVTFNVTSDLSAGDEFTITIGGITNPDHNLDYDNPLSAITHLIDVNMRDSEDDSLGRAQTQVAIIDSVTMTAAVETTFSFSVEGVASGLEINGTTTTRSASSTRLDFGIIEPDQFNYIAQRLEVNTNASNGFLVTVQESQELTSSTGERIHRFQNATSGDVGLVEPAVWESPEATLDVYRTYGHYGITTTDEELDVKTESGYDDGFTGEDPGFVGNFHQEPRPVFGHTGPTTDEETHAGYAHVGVGIEISVLQPAGNDYTNTLTYVATPTF